MIVVIQCAASKRNGAGSFRTADGLAVRFVAQPGKAPRQTGIVYCRPDDLVDGQITWRTKLIQYNRDRGNNPLRLLPAYQLYENPVYAALVESLCAEKVYILSAGWGLVPATYLLPEYDITFSYSAEDFKKREKNDSFDDLSLLKISYEEVVFLGGKDYIPLFVELTKRHPGERRIFYNSVTKPVAPGCVLERYETKTRTNWHYECAREIASKS